ncbi:hypothetical protein [Nocardioides sp. NPDC127503]|uniref:hypothetical protein n=1 Tax=Nocardioides sp. NPDC127503 TaxID=3154516 RepID=UPI003319B7C8
MSGRDGEPAQDWLDEPNHVDELRLSGSLLIEAVRGEDLGRCSETGCISRIDDGPGDFVQAILNHGTSHFASQQLLQNDAI